MHKKLMAVAVAGALTAPAIALAQSTVQIYGQLEWEQGYIDQGDGRPNTDYNESTGSYIGFRGTEALGGGMSAWFQCETTADIRGFDQVGLCSRNSGVGFRGGFGNVWVGRWHTPMSRAVALGSVGGEETGILGTSYLAAGGSGSTSIACGTTATGASNSTADCGSGLTQLRYRFRRRETCLTTYETPSFGGFMVGAAVSCGNGSIDQPQGSATNQANDKPRVYSIAGTYINGPIALGLSYEKHTNVGAYVSGAPELDDRGWGISAAYTWGPVKIGAIYLDRKWEMGNATTQFGDLKKKSAAVGFDWRIAGPHSLSFNYNWLDDTEGSCQRATAALTAASCSLNATSAGGIAPIGSNSGAQSYSIGYQYDFSKRTSAKVGYILMDNDSRSSAARVGVAAAPLPGEDQSAFALIVKHRF